MLAVPDTLQQILDNHQDEIRDTYVRLMQESSLHYAETPRTEIEANVNRSLPLIGVLYHEAASDEARAYIRSLCEQRVPRGFRLAEVLNAIFLLGDVVVPVIRRVYLTDIDNARKASDQLRAGINALALLWAEGYYDLQQEMMDRKELAMRQLSTPVSCVWDGILMLPLLGDVDDRRSRQVTEDLLNAIVSTQSTHVLLDVTGLGDVNTGVIAQLMRTVRAAELLGAECWIVGITPDVAQTIVGLGVDLGQITTYADLRDGLQEALRQTGVTVVTAEDTPVCPRPAGAE